MSDVDTTDVVEPEEPQPEVGVFMPPLQAELELFKKSNDLDNVYDRESCDEPVDYEEESDAAPEDELDRMKKMAGIEPTVIVKTSNSPTF